MTDLPGKIRVQDAALANMVTIAAILEYLDQNQPGAKNAIETRAHEIAVSIKEGSEDQPSGEESGEEGTTDGA